jgi:hypothetical protein
MLTSNALGFPSLIHGDATKLVGSVTHGTVFFLYCPFSGERIRELLDALEPIARAKPIRLCSIDTPLPSCAWLRRVHGAPDVAIYESV